MNLINTDDILQVIDMIESQHLDIRTITMGISLLDCIDPDVDRCIQREDIFNAMHRI